MDDIQIFRKYKFHFTKLVENIDIILCFGMLLTGLVILYLSYKSGIGQYEMGLAFSFGSIAYYLLKKKVDFKKISMNYVSDQDHKINHTLFLTTNIVFVICFTLSIALLYNIQYIRPPLYFILVTIAFFSIFLETFNIPDNGIFKYIAMLKILILSLSFRVGRYYTFPTIPGSDTHAHLMFAKSIIANGEIVGANAGKYLYTPLWHVFEAINNIILNVNLRDTLFISLTATSMVIISLFAYLITKKLFNVKVGLIAFLFVNIADMLFVRMVTNINTGIFVHIFFIIALFCLIQEKNKPIYSFFMLLLIVDSILTHQLSTFIFFSVLFVFSISQFMYLQFRGLLTEYKDINVKTNITSNFVLFFFIFMIFYWSTMGPSEGSTFFDSMFLRLHGTFIDMFNDYVSTGSSSTIYVNLFSNYTMISNLMYNMGYNILFGLAIIGILILLKQYRSSMVIIKYICGSIFLFTLIYPGTYLGLDQMFIPHRFISFLELFLIIFAAFSVYILFKINITKWNKVCTSVIVLFLIFFMITTPFINRNDALYSTDHTVVTGYTSSELKTLEWGTNYIAEKLYVDPLIATRPISTVEEFNISIGQIAHYSARFNEKNIPHNVYMREYVVDKPDLVLSGTFGKQREVNLALFIELLSEKHNLIYSSNSGYIYHKDGSK